MSLEHSQKDLLREAKAIAGVSNFTFKVDPVNNTCALSRVTVGTEGAPKAYQPKNPQNPSAVAFDLNGCKEFLNLQARYPNAQYCNRVSDGIPMNLDGLSDDEVYRLQNSQPPALVGGAMPSASLIAFCKTYPSSDLEKLFKQDRLKAGDLCPPLGGTNSSAVIRYVLNYTVTHPQAPVGTNSAPGSTSPVGQTQ